MTKANDIFYATRSHFEAHCRRYARHDPDDSAILFGDTRIFLFPDDKLLAKHLYEDGFWESWVTLAAARAVDDVGGGRVLNIGANFGYYALLFAKLGCEVVAVEPQSSLCGLMARSALANGMTMTIHTGVVSDHDGTETLHIPRAPTGVFYGNASVAELARTPGTATRGGVTWEPTEVLAMRLESAAQPDTSLIFCDAEGHEPAIFQGCASYFESNRPRVILEFSPARYTDPCAFARWWTSIGYTARLVDYDGLTRPIDLEMLTEERMIYLAPKG